MAEADIERDSINGLARLFGARARAFPYPLAKNSEVNRKCRLKWILLIESANLIQGRHFNFFLRGQIFLIFQCHRTIEKLEKNITL